MALAIVVPVLSQRTRKDGAAALGIVAAKRRRPRLRRARGGRGRPPLHGLCVYELLRGLGVARGGCLLEAAYAEDPGEAAEQHEGGCDGEGGGEVAGFVDKASGERGAEDAGEVGESVLQADPSSGGFGAGEGLSEGEDSGAADSGAGALGQHPWQVVIRAREG